MKLKFTLILALGLFFSVSGYSQLSLGGGLAYGTEVDQLGLFVRGGFNLTEKFRVNLTPIFYFSDNLDIAGIEIKSTGFSLAGEANYMIIDDTNLNVYALGGLSWDSVTVSTDLAGVDDESDSELGINLGGGIEFGSEGGISPFAEVKYTIGGFDQLVLQGGVFVRFE